MMTSLSTAFRQPEPTRVSPASLIPDARRQIIKNARQSWIRKLIDLSRRNNLLYFRPLKTGTLELTSAPSERLHDLLMGQSVAVAKLAPDPEGEALPKILRDIFQRALANSEEKGLSTLFVTFGMATWPALDGAVPRSRRFCCCRLQSARKKAAIPITSRQQGPSN
jgi:Protein of unknown function (DUF4011)